MKIVLNHDDIKKAISDYIQKKFEGKPLTVFNFKIKRKNSNTEEVGSISVEFEDKT